MIKGVNHTIIEVPHPCNRYFERALLFVRPELSNVEPRHLQAEADRWIEMVDRPPAHRTVSRSARRARRIRFWIAAAFWWLVGTGCGALLCSLIR